MLDPAAPSVKKGSRSAAKSRTVNRDLTCDQYGMCRLHLGQLVHTHTIPLPNITSPQTGISQLGGETCQLAASMPMGIVDTTQIVFENRVVSVVVRPYTGNSRMRKAAEIFESVRALGREFPDLHESTMYGSPSLKLGKRLVACIAIHRSAEPGSLVVRTDFEQRSALLGDDPETYYVTDHYARHPVVLVRLARVQHDQLRDLLAAARQCVLAHAKRSYKKTRLQEYEGHSPRR